jgi:hypothetical protein
VFFVVAKGKIREHQIIHLGATRETNEKMLKLLLQIS